jgi:hypothetical protein
MKREITITLKFDPDEYKGAEDTARGAIHLAVDMLKGDADLPPGILLECEGYAKLTGESLFED